MTTIVLNAAITLTAFIGMEGVAWTTHKYLMHGWLWTLHKDHHLKETAGFFERNDFFFLIFALPGMSCMFLGVMRHYDRMFFIGLGIALYGFAYFLVHDIFIHQRFRLFRNTDNRYFRSIRRAHKVHHKHLEKDNGECFGMLWVPFKYFRNGRKADNL